MFLVPDAVKTIKAFSITQQSHTVHVQGKVYTPSHDFVTTFQVTLFQTAIWDMTSLVNEYEDDIVSFQLSIRLHFVIKILFTILVYFAQ